MRELGAALAAETARQPARRERQAASIDVDIPSIPETVVWGHLPTDRPAIATLSPGQRARVQTVSHQGMVDGRHPYDFFADHGIERDAVLDDVVAIYEQVARPPDAAGHVLTGPIDVEGARPGDAVEVRIVTADLRVPYGVNRGVPGTGILPDLLDAVDERLLVLDPETGRYPFAPGISLPCAPFPGIVAVTPPADAGFVSSRPPGRWGGNLDVKALTPGARLILPVLRSGAGLYLGDPHGAQGDGEVNGTAIEQSSAYTIEVAVHPGLAPGAPVLVTDDRVTCLGIDVDLDLAVEQAVRNLVALLVGWTGTLAPADAYALCSLAGDVGVAEVVNHTQVATASVPLALLGGEL